MLISNKHQIERIPWHEAKLFAVIAGAGARSYYPPLFYELSSSKAIIRWSVKPGGQGDSLYAPTGIMGRSTSNGMLEPYPSKELYEEQMQTLVTLVAARTHLPLHDLQRINIK